jgi:hypothetical protein
MEACAKCNADGSVLCSLCKGQGLMKCQTCAATGLMKCSKCAGTGWLSHLAHVELEARIHFEYDRSTVPQQVARMIATYGPKLVERGDIEIQLRPDVLPIYDAHSKDGADPEQQKPQEAVITLEYDAKVPFGPIRFQFPDRIVPGALFGYQGRVIEAPSFLDDLTKLGQQVLSDAAAAKGNVAGNILRAAKYKMLQDVIVQTAVQGSRRRAHAVLAGRYTTGIFSEKLMVLTGQADLAMRNATRVPRYVGLGGGVILFAALCWGYFLAGGRPALLSAGVPEIVLSLLDALLIPTGTGLGGFSARFAAFFAQSRILKKIMPTELEGKVPLPKAGKAPWWALGFSAVTVMASLYLTLHTPLEPAWLASLLSRL